MALRPKLSNNRKRKIKMLLGRAFEALQNGEQEQCEQLCKATAVPTFIDRVA